MQGLEARFVHFADLAAPLSGAEQAVLAQLLTYGPSLPAASAATASRILIVPRAGTISPWSSKATDIAQVCGLRAGAPPRARHRVRPERGAAAVAGRPARGSPRHCVTA